MEEELSLAMPAFFDPTERVDIDPRDLDAILNDDLLERAESMELLNWTSTDPRTFMAGGGHDHFHQPIMGDQWVTPGITQSEAMRPVFSEKFVGSTYSCWLVMTCSLIFMKLIPPGNFEIHRKSLVQV